MEKDSLSLSLAIENIRELNTPEKHPENEKIIWHLAGHSTRYCPKLL